MLHVLAITLRSSPICFSAEKIISQGLGLNLVVSFKASNRSLIRFGTLFVRLNKRS